MQRLLLALSSNKRWDSPPASLKVTKVTEVFNNGEAAFVCFVFFVVRTALLSEDRGGGNIAGSKFQAVPVSLQLLQ
jgi:hypothetical protein